MSPTLVIHVDMYWSKPSDGFVIPLSESPFLTTQVSSMTDLVDSLSKTTGGDRIIAVCQFMWQKESGSVRPFAEDTAAVNSSVRAYQIPNHLLGENNRWVAQFASGDLIPLADLDLDFLLYSLNA